MRRLEGRTAVVTGGGSAGFGRAIAARVARGRRERRDRRSRRCRRQGDRRQVEEVGGEADLVVADISTEAGALRLITEAAERFGQVDVLVNNAGIAPAESVDSWNAPESSWDRVIQINLKTRVRLLAGRDPAA